MPVDFSLAAILVGTKLAQADGGVMNGADGNPEPEKSAELRCAIS
jgi:hypothetical protein